MSDDIQKTTFQFDLDNQEMVSKLLATKNLISDLGNAQNLEGLISGFTKVGAGVAVVGAVLFTLKKTLDLVFDAENIKAINNQFETLGENAGIATDALKEGLVNAAGGLIDDTELLKIANRSIIEMGQSAAKLPEVLQLARQATSAFGGDLAQNFEALNHAIATGQVKQLKNLGIVIDQAKAMQDYAKSIGVTVGALSEAGKQHAMMNAVIERGKTAFQGVNVNATEAQNTWQALKVTLSQVGEVVTLAFEKIAGPTVRQYLSGLRDMATDLKNWVQASYGEGAEASAAKTQILHDKIRDVKAELIDIDQMRLKGQDFTPGFTEARIQALNTQLKQYQDELGQTTAKTKELHDAGSHSKGAGSGESAVDKEKQLQAEAAYQKELIALKQATLQQDMQFADTEEEVDAITAEQKELVEQETAQKIQQIHSDLAQGKIANEEQANQLIVEINEQKTNKLLQLEDDLEQKRTAALKRAVDESQSSAEGIAQAFKSGAAMNKASLADFGTEGQKTFDSFAKNSKSALLDLGAGTKTATQAMKEMFLNVIADRAESEGEMLMLSGLWPPNPLALAAGAGLVALAGFIRSKAGGSSSSSGVSAGGSSSGIQSGNTYGTRTDTPPTLAQQQEQKSVNLIIQGHLFDTNETRQWITDQVRAASDATDFKVSSVGGGF